MDQTLFILVLVVAAAVCGVAGLSRYIGQFKIGERMAARRAAYKIENASANQAFDDPLLRALISCPNCGAAGQFDVIGKNQCQCHNCSTTWEAS